MIVKNKLTIFILILIAFLIIPVSITAQQAGKYSNAGIDNDASVETFFLVLQESVSKDARDKVADMINYPLRVNSGGHIEVIQKKSTFLKRYESVFTSQVKEALGKQNVSGLFVNSQGVMIGNGEIWFNKIFGSNNIRIIAINN